MQYYPDPGVWYAVANPNHAMTIAQCSDWWCGMLLADVSYWSMMYWWTCMHDEWNVLMNDVWWMVNLYTWWMMYCWTCMHDERCTDELVCMMNDVLMNLYAWWMVYWWIPMVTDVWWTFWCNYWWHFAFEWLLYLMSWFSMNCLVGFLNWLMEWFHRILFEHFEIQFSSEMISSKQPLNCTKEHT